MLCFSITAINHGAAMISKEYLKSILLEQRQRIIETKSQSYTEREKLKKITTFIKIKSSIIVTGIRRCGKSVFISQIINLYFKNYYFVNFEDERLSHFTLDDFNLLNETCIELFGNTKSFFLDEIQNISGWEKWVRRMHDSGYKFFITGSNARLLSKELATLLTGRNIQFSIYPFSFREFLNFKKLSLNKDDIYITEKRAIIGKYFSEYVKTGGFPEYLKDKRIEILQSYFNDIIQRDIVERHKVTNIKYLKELARYLITNTGNPATFNSLKRAVNIKSTTTTIKYFSYIEDAYLVFSVPFFSYSLKKQSVNPFKVYAIDVGLRKAISFQFSKDMGQIFETLVAIALKQNNIEFYYWKNKKNEEVDFVIKEKKSVTQLIQVCYDLSDADTEERENRALLSAAEELRTRKLIIINSDIEKEVKYKGRTISYIPLWKWLLIT